MPLDGGSHALWGILPLVEGVPCPSEEGFRAPWGVSHPCCILTVISQGNILYERSTFVVSHDQLVSFWDDGQFMMGFVISRRPLIASHA